MGMLLDGIEASDDGGDRERGGGSLRHVKAVSEGIIFLHSEYAD